jgi:hypothetical protein
LFCQRVIFGLSENDTLLLHLINSNV